MKFKEIFGTPPPPIIIEAMATNALSILCLSDTHGQHRHLGCALPNNIDLLIHAGDFTHFGKERDVLDFAMWLAEVDCPMKIVVNGNHENNASWKYRAQELLSAHCPHGTVLFLKQEEATVSVKGRQMRVFGTEFFWPCPSGNPYYEQIPDGIDILIAHGPPSNTAKGGCPSLQARIDRIKPKLVVSGHIHELHGVVRGDSTNTVYVNAAICGAGTYKAVNPPILLTWDQEVNRIEHANNERKRNPPTE